MNLNRMILWMGALAVAVGLAGCGYQQANDYSGKPSGKYVWHSLYREDIRSVAVPIFTNTDFERGVEFSLTKAVVNQLEAHTPYKVVSRDRADTILEGHIVAVRRGTVSYNPNNVMPQEQLITVSVNFIWKDLRTGQILVERKGFDQTSTYYPTLGEGRFVGTQNAVEKMALGIVQELQADW